MEGVDVLKVLEVQRKVLKARDGELDTLWEGRLFLVHQATTPSRSGDVVWRRPSTTSRRSYSGPFDSPFPSAPCINPF